MSKENTAQIDTMARAACAMVSIVGRLQPRVMHVRQMHLLDEYASCLKIPKGRGTHKNIAGSSGDSLWDALSWGP